MKNRKLVYGVGVNDADYVVHKAKIVDGKFVNAWTCKAYSMWSNMLMRCNSTSYQNKNPTYKGCYVSAEWHSFMAFKKWLETQPSGSGYHLDKDIIYPGNKCYGEDFCAIISADLNLFVSRDPKRTIIGIEDASGECYKASCRNPFTRKNEYLGSFGCETDAVEAWRKRKHEHSCRYAEMQANPRLAAALRIRYA